MNIKHLVAGMDAAKHNCSLLLINPRPIFLHWLEGFVDLKFKEWGLGRMYHDFENSVVLIPDVGLFAEQGSFEKFLDEFKPVLLQAELARFRASPIDFGRPINKETFDENFELSVRQYVQLLSDYGEYRPMFRKT